MPVIAKRVGLPEHDLTVRLFAAAVTGAFRVVDEEVSTAVIVDNQVVGQAGTLATIDRTIRVATNGQLGGPVTD